MQILRWFNSLNRVEPQELRSLGATLSLIGIFGFLTNNFGQLAPQLNHLLALVLLGVFASFQISVKDLHFEAIQKNQLLLGIGSFSLALISWMTGHEIERCLAVIFFVVALNLIQKALGHPTAKGPVYVTAATLMSFYVVFYQYVPFVWYAIQKSSLFLSSTLSHLTKQDMLFGATASGLHLLIFCLLYLASFFWLSKERSWKALTGIVLGAGAVHLLYLILHKLVLVPFLQLFQNPYHVGHPHYQPYVHTALSTSIFLLMLLALPLFVAEKHWKVRQVSLAPVSKLSVVLGVGLIFLGMLAFAFFPIEGQTTRQVFLYDKGYLNWDKPEFGKYGDRNAGMFGLLPEFLPATGFGVKTGAVISDETLRGCQTLVVINLQEPFTPEEHAALWKFVHQGGSLLALGDHTGLAGICEPTNQLLKPVGIELNFDCAHYIGNWDHAFEVLPHPVTQGVSTQQELGISVGASLNIPPTATPLVTGKYGFSDLGNPNATHNAFLGDRQYNPGEHLGDVVLVASAHYGSGKVLVFGDTSTFQNGALVQNHQFVRQVFSWLASRPSSSFSSLLQYHIGLGMLLFLLGFGMFLMRKPAFPELVPYLAGVLLFGLWGANLVNAARQPMAPIQGKIAYIDTSHLERMSSEFYKDESFLGLTYNLLRNGYLPIAMDHFSPQQLQASQVFLALAPAQSFSQSELDSIKHFMGTGGTFILCAGGEDTDGSETLLQAFGLGIEPVPLGPVTSANNTAGAHFYNAWPIRVDHPQTTEILSSFKDPSYPLIVKQEWGAGRFIFIGDTGFLLNANLESLKGYIPENITFFKELLQSRSAEDSKMTQVKKEQ